MLESLAQGIMGGLGLIGMIILFLFVLMGLIGTVWAVISGFKNNGLVMGLVLAFLIIATAPIGWAVYFIAHRRGVL